MAFPPGKHEAKQVARVILPAESQRKASSWRQSGEASLLETVLQKTTQGLNEARLWVQGDTSMLSPCFKGCCDKQCWRHLWWLRNATERRGKAQWCLNRTGTDLYLFVRWWPGRLNPGRDSSDYMDFLHNAAYDQVILIFLYSQWREMCIFRMQSILI